LTPCFDTESDPVIVTVTTPTTEPTQEAPTTEFLLGQMTTQMAQVTETLNTLSSRMESLEMSDRWTEDSLRELWTTMQQTREQAEAATVIAAEAAIVAEVAAEEAAEPDGALETEEANESETLPEVPPQTENPEEIQQQQIPGEPKKSFFHWRNWI